MSSRAMFVFAAISGFMLVAFGAFGAHVLSKSLGPAEMAWIHTGLEYQAYHTLAVIGLGRSGKKQGAEQRENRQRSRTHSDSGSRGNSE